ncbi:retrovirus-related pol polyprotein from transposon TNT 1-94 [Tanacetum coccineum]
MSPCFRKRLVMMLLEHKDVIAKFCGPSRWKELSKETSSKILLCGDGSCWKTFNPIASKIFSFSQDNVLPNKSRASIRKTPITVSQPHVIHKENVNSNPNGFSSTVVESTAKTRRPQPKSNTKNDRVPSASKSSGPMNKKVEVEEHHRNLLLSKNKRHMSSKCNNIKLVIQNAKSKVKQKANVSNVANQQKQKLKVRKPKKVGSKERLTSTTPSAPSTYRRLYYVEGLGHNLFSVGQFCESDLEVAFRRNTCYVRNLDGVDLLKGSRTTNLYNINLHEMASVSLSFLMARATSTKSWLWHQRLSYLNFDTINDLARNDLVIGLPKSKDEAPEEIKTFLKKITVRKLQSSSTPQQNGVVERRNGMLVEAARTMLIISCALLFLWVEAIATACYTQNDFIIRRRFNKTPYELINGRIPDISFLHVFGALCYPKNDHEDIGKLGAKAMYDDYLSGQPSATSRTALAAQAPQVLQTPTTSTTIADSAPTTTNSSLQVADNVLNATIDGNAFVNPFASPTTDSPESFSSQYVDPPNMHTFYQPYPYEYWWTKDHPLKKVIGEPSRPFLTRNQLRTDGDMCNYALMVSTVEPRNVKEAITNPAWIESMQEELLQFKRLDVWELIPLPDNIEGLIQIVHCVPNGRKTIFLHGSLKEYVYVCQPKRFIDSDHPSHNHFNKGTIDPTLFTRCFDDDILMVWVYVDDIMIGCTNPIYTQLFADLMKSRFEISMIGEMTFFLNLQVNQSPRGIFINQFNYMSEILTKYGMDKCDPIGTPTEQKDKLELDQNGTLVDAMKYHSMIGALMYLTSSRPDIIHATCFCARYQAKPTEKHLKEIKRIFRYL